MKRPRPKPTVPLEARGSFRLLGDRLFGPFFWGRLLSSCGIWIHNIVAAIAAFALTNSALAVGVVSAAQFIPQLLFAPLSGKMADHGHLPRQIAIGRVITAFGSAGLAAWIWLAGGLDGLPNALPVIGASLIVGTGFVVGGPAMHAIVPAMIRPGEMASAMALNSVPITVARAAGPALGALVAINLGPAEAFAVAAACNALFAVLVIVLPLPAGGGHSEDTDFSVRASLRHLRVDRGLIVLLLGIAAVSYGSDPSLTLAPSLAAHLGGGDSVAGGLASAFGIGAGVGFLLFAPLHHWFGLSRLAGGGLVVMAIGLVALSAVSTVHVALAMLALSGIGMTLAFTSITTEIQNRSPDALRGRIMALWSVGWLGSRPLGASLNGIVADAISVRSAVLITAAVVLLVAWLCRPSRFSREC